MDSYYVKKTTERYGVLIAGRPKLIEHTRLNKHNVNYHFGKSTANKRACMIKDYYIEKMIDVL